MFVLEQKRWCQNDKDCVRDLFQTHRKAIPAQSGMQFSSCTRPPASFTRFRIKQQNRTSKQTAFYFLLLGEPSGSCGRWQQQEGDVMCQQYSAFESTVYILRRQEKEYRNRIMRCGAVQDRSTGVSLDSDILMHGMLAIFGQLFYCMICVLFWVFFCFF